MSFFMRIFIKALYHIKVYDELVFFFLSNKASMRLVLGALDLEMKISHKLLVE